ncbi:MAG: peptidyl-prolyl cis-trans isomerase [Phycisphaerae bacterium]|nr:peptidyl-prolyl cis-trans isomerase [Phycisphaerae bacterium]
MRKYVFLTTLALFLYGCQGGGKSDSIEKSTQKTNPKKSSDGLVITVADETITSDEIITAASALMMPIAQSSNFENFKRQAKPKLEEMITARISNILLYQEAKKNTREDIDQILERPAEAEIRKYIIDFGGDYAKAEEALKQQGMDWAGFKKYQKKMILTEYYLGSLLPRAAPITYSELLARYNQMKDESFVTLAAVKFQLIDIEPAKLQITDPNQDQLEQARMLANELLKQIKAGKNFPEVAKEHNGVSFAAHSKPVQPASLRYSILADEAEKLEAGEISGPIETPQQSHIFIMKLQEKHPKGYEPFEKVQREVEATIISDRRKQAQDKILTRLSRQAENELSDEFAEFCLQKIYERNSK